MTDAIASLDWPPLVWMLRGAAILLGILVNLILVVSLIRFVRYSYDVVIQWKNLPAIESISGKVWGQEFALKARIDDLRDVQLETLEARIDNLEVASRNQAEALSEIVSELRGGDSENAW